MVIRIKMKSYKLEGTLQDVTQLNNSEMIRYISIEYLLYTFGPFSCFSVVKEVEFDFGNFTYFDFLSLNFKV